MKRRIAQGIALCFIFIGPIGGLRGLTAAEALAKSEPAPQRLFPRAKASPPPNCFIETETTLKTGEVTKSTSSYRFSERKECEKMNRILGERFSARWTEKKKTSFRWTGK